MSHLAVVVVEGAARPLLQEEGAAVRREGADLWRGVGHL